MTNVAFTDIYPNGPPGSAAAVAAGASDTNGLYPGMPVGATPIHRDIELVAASPGGTTIWDPGASNRFVVASAFVNTNGAGRVALVDGTDIQGSRIFDADLAANSGATPNLVPVPYPSKNPGTPLVLISTVAGNVKVHVSGWLQPT